MKNDIRVLIVDDNIEFTRLLNGFINKQEDMCVSGIAKDGVEAIEMIETLTPDVVVLDIIMPNLDGLGVLEKFKGDMSENRPLFIVLSAIGQDIFIRRTISLGAEYYIIKPFDVSILISRIREIFYEKKTAHFSCESSVSTQCHNSNIYNDKHDNIELRATNILRKAGIPPHMSGYKYLREGIVYAAKKPSVLNSVTKILYPYIADKFLSSPQKVERAMRNALEKAWKEGISSEVLRSLFGHVFSPMRRPANSEFIAVVSDKIRLGL